MMVINNAYKILKEPTKRAEYDRKRALKSSYEQQKKRSAAASSSTSTSSGTQQQSSSQRQSSRYNTDDFIPPPPEWYTNMYENMDDIPVESLSDFLRDLFIQLKLEGGKSVLRDIADFLEEKASNPVIHEILICLFF